MARGINKVVLIGHLGAPPEVRRTRESNPIATLRLATSDSWKDKASGEVQERTEWHRVKLFGSLAEVAERYLIKGSQVFIEGSLRTEKYTDRNGSERWSTEVIGNEMLMLGPHSGAKPSRAEPQPAAQQVEDDPYSDIPF